jgi:hypothetical protein
MTKDYAKGSPLISIARPNLVRQTSENTVKRKSNFGERRLGEVRPGSGNTKPERYRYRYRTVSGGRLQKRGRILAWGLRFCEVLETNPMQGGPARRRGADNGSDARSADGHCSAYSDPKKEKSHIPEQNTMASSSNYPSFEPMQIQHAIRVYEMNYFESGEARKACIERETKEHAEHMLRR